MFREFTNPNSIVNPIYLSRRILFEIDNRRREQIDRIGYVLFTLDEAIPMLPESRNFIRRRIFGDPPLSLVELERAFRLIADDPRTPGVVLHLRGMQMSLADLQTLRDIMLRLREKGKRVLCYATNYDTATYYIASAADEILLQPSGMLQTIGLRLSSVFLKEALERVGVEIESVAISPFKGALDQFTRNDISPEGEQQLNWLLDSRYEMIVKGIAEGRDMSADAVREMIDNAPYTDQTALEKGYVDALVNEEGFAAHLNTRRDHITTWDTAKKQLFLKWNPPTEKFVALLPIVGAIVDGESASPPVDVPVPLLGGERAGDLTVVQQIRRLMDNDGVAAVIVYVDSPGGSASASEAMASALDELAKTRPVVVYMNGVAASGGYYVATPAQWIVAQPGTITGSIGVVSGKPTTQGAFEKLRINRIEFTRGANADFASDQHPYTEAQRQQTRDAIESIYHQFTGRVAASRDMSQEAVDGIGGGRVWTGQQAIENGLVDELGDLRTALNKARELANLPDHAPLVLPNPQRNRDKLAPRLAEQVDPAAGLKYMHTSLKLMFNGRAQLLSPLFFED